MQSQQHRVLTKLIGQYLEVTHSELTSLPYSFEFYCGGGAAISGTFASDVALTLDFYQGPRQGKYNIKDTEAVSAGTNTPEGSGGYFDIKVLDSWCKVVIDGAAPPTDFSCSINISTNEG